MIPLFDAHCDTAFLLSDTYSLRRNNGHVDLERGSKYFPRAQIFAIFNDLARVPDIVSACFSMLDRLILQIERNSDIVKLCTSRDDMENLFSCSKQAAFISVEGAEQLGCSPQLLEAAFQKGVRVVNITWNHANILSGSHCDDNRRGLSDEGRAFVQKCCELGVLIDVSHLSENGFWDAAEISKLPIIASHSDSYSVCPHSRNLTDDQFKAIINCGGAVGINLYTEFIGKNADIDAVLSHIEHFLSLGGEKNVGIGADFDGCDFLPSGISGVEDLDKLYERLLRENYCESLVNDIFFNNFARVISTLTKENENEISQYKK